MRLSEYDGQFSEVLVQCDKHAIFVVCPPENRAVARIGDPIASANHIMSCRDQFLLGFTPDTGVKQKPQAAAFTSTGEKYSCETRRLA